MDRIVFFISFSKVIILTHLLGSFLSAIWRSAYLLEVSSFHLHQKYLLHTSKCTKYDSRSRAYCIYLWMLTCGSKWCRSGMISGFNYHWPPIRIPCITMSLALFLRWGKVIVIYLFDISVWRCLLMVLYEKYFTLLLAAVRILFSLIMVYSNKGL